MKTVLETVLLASQEPLPVAELKKLFDEEPATDTLRRVLDELRRDWQGRGVELVQVASGWRFRARPMAPTWPPGPWAVTPGQCSMQATWA